jgi:hypothetical protein
MKIKITDKTLGECEITTFKEIGKSEEYMIKSLCMLQLMCMNKEDNPEKFTEFITRLKNASDQIHELYHDKSNPDADPTELYY